MAEVPSTLTLKPGIMPEVMRMEDFPAGATEWIAGRIVATQTERGPGGRAFLLSLCGGGTPKPVYRALAGRADIDWTRVVITFGDERCVGPEEAESNYRMARETLIDPAGIPESNVHRIHGELEPAEAARSYDSALRTLAAGRNEAPLSHDLMLLGVGEDGHTASLFPGTRALGEERRWAVENYVEKFSAYRITMTYPVINASREIVFLVNGEAKLPVIDRVLKGSDDPATGVRPESGAVTWLVGV